MGFSKEQLRKAMHEAEEQERRVKGLGLGKEVGRIEGSMRKDKRLVVEYNKDRVILSIRKDTLRGERSCLPLFQGI